ncbi:MAG: hypothetical protein ACLTSX_05970 [Collinsella sp.]
MVRGAVTGRSSDDIDGSGDTVGGFGNIGSKTGATTRSPTRQATTLDPLRCV